MDRADRDPVEVKAEALIRFRLVGYDRGMEPSKDGAYVTYADALALARTAEARGAEGMRAAANRMTDERIAAALSALPASDAPASPWRSMDSAPKDGTKVNVLDWLEDGTPFLDVAYFSEWNGDDYAPGWFSASDDMPSCTPKMWSAIADLPTPPVKDETA